MSLLLTITAVVGTCAILAHYVRRLKHLSRWDHFPGFKSYSSIPLAGHVWRISNFLQHFRQMQADYGDMFRLDWGDRPTVYVCSHELASEALSSDAFNGTPHKDMMGLNQIFKVDEAGYQSGSFSVGHSWMRVRNFLLAQLDDFEQGAMPVGSVEGVVREEAVSLCDLMSSAVREAGGKPFALHRLLRPVPNNVLWRFTSGRRTHYTDPEVQLLNQSLDNYFKIMDPTSVTSYLPWLHYLILYLRMEHAWFGRLCKALRLGSEITDFSKDMEALFRAEVASGVQDPSGSYVDRFMAVSARTPFKISPFHPRNAGTQLMGSLFALFLTGPFLVTSFLEWTVLYLIAFPGVQKKAREEILKVIGGGSAKMSDRNSTPFVAAVVEEIMRHCPMYYTNAAHSNLEEAELGGFTFPKDTILIVNYGAIQRDPTHFDDPHEFRPERHLDPATGRFVQCARTAVFFGLGQRRCPGENLARVQLYLFFVALVQHFQFEAAEGETVDVEKATTKGFLVHPKPYDVRVESVDVKNLSRFGSSNESA